MGRRGRDWDERADDLSREAIDAGDPSAWFDTLYAEGVAGRVGMPWDRDEPQRELAPWFESWLGAGSGAGRSAVVVGCGLGADAEHLAAHGFATTGFDVAPTAIAEARARHPDSPVDYRVADLLDLDPALVGRFDLVVEIFTLQALPDPPRPAAAAAVASLLAPGGTLVVIAFRDVGGPAATLPPFPLTIDDLRLLEVRGVRLVRADEVGTERWVVTFTREG